MKPEPKQILSVSRRTDIPAFYMPWFMDQVHRECIEVINPFNQQVRRVAVSPATVHTMVFWSKNFGPFLDGGYGEQLQVLGYHLFFNFTVNSQLPILEPGVPDLARRLGQLRELCRRFGGAAVQWRFDPICHYTVGTGGIQNNLADFETIAAVAGDCGIDLCITVSWTTTGKLPGGQERGSPSWNRRQRIRKPFYWACKRFWRLWGLA